MKALRFLLPFATLTLGLALTAPAAYAHEREGDEGDEMASKLDFTAAQRTQMDDIEYHAKAARIGIKAREETAELDLRHAMHAATVDEKAVSKALDALNTAEADMRKSKVDEMLAVRKLLTPDQATKLATMWHEDGEDDDDDDDAKDDDEHHADADKDDEEEDEKDEHHGGHGEHHHEGHDE